MLQVKNVSKEYVTGSLVQRALDGVSLDLRDNEFVAILGPSGSGKTTLLNIIGGLDRYDSGDLIVNGVSTKEYRDRDWDTYRNHTVGFVFQNYNLIPHQNVLSNVEIALTISGASREERKAKAKEALEKVGLGEHIYKRPSQLSGGQMQRVAIARALVNDPDILLADEPTGALDSDTSVQVMDLLKEVSEDRLVVMVTHNAELADEYATRIVNIKDGKIVGDTDPFVASAESTMSALTAGPAGAAGAVSAPAAALSGSNGMGAKKPHAKAGTKKKRSSMSLLTALSLSFNNLKTKKARTILVSIAGSIGIIGIALIMAISQGLTNYIGDIEESTVRKYPITIYQTAINFYSLMPEYSSQEEAEEGVVKVDQLARRIAGGLESNDLKSLKAHLESEDCDIYDYALAVEYTYNISPNIYRIDGENIRRVQPEESLSASSALGVSEMDMTIVNLDSFHVLPQNESLYKDMYEVKTGRWPENENECVVVLSDNGSATDMMLYAAGVKDTAELDQIAEDLMAGRNVQVLEDPGTFKYDDFMDKEFKVVNSCSYYTYDERNAIWVDNRDNKEFVKGIVPDGHDLKITGVVMAKDASGDNMLSAGIYYEPELALTLMKEAEASEVVKAQIAAGETNVLTGRPFGDDGSNSGFDIQDLFTIDQNAFMSAFHVDMSKLDLSKAFSGADLADMDIMNMLDFGKIIGSVDISQADMEAIAKQLGSQISEEDVRALLTDLMEGFVSYIGTEIPTTTDEFVSKFTEYMQTSAPQQKINSFLQEHVNTPEVQAMLAALGDKASDAIGKELGRQMGPIMQEYSKKIQNALVNGAKNIDFSKVIWIDKDAIAKSFQVNITEDELRNMIYAMLSGDRDSYAGNLLEMGYTTEAEPIQIAIYPKDFLSKDGIVKVLDGYNADAEKSGHEEKIVSYSDFAGTIMNAITDIVGAVSKIMIALVAVSLIVSSIMIAVITHISVLERRKEIGILRAIGASKHNIASVFNAETFITGLFAGLLGVGIARILLIPANFVIHTVFGRPDISAVLPVAAAVGLVALSVLLTVVSGLVPARKAAKSDPVMALRGE